MINRAIQYFFLAALLLPTTLSRAAEPQVGDICKWTLTDVDQRRLASSDGRITILVVAGREDAKRASEVGDRVPKQFMAQPRYRFVTLINFHGNIFAPLRGLTNALIRRRLSTETERIQKTYDENHFNRAAHDDLFAAADYDGSGVAQFGVTLESKGLFVFVLDENGRVRGRWDCVPPAHALIAALTRTAE